MGPGFDPLTAHFHHRFGGGFFVTVVGRLEKALKLKRVLETTSETWLLAPFCYVIVVLELPATQLVGLRA